ncbi:MAG: carbohydrate porin [Rhodanobacteraceae bacterium]|nr:carbohydrate porin [Rhodanobacteraceae bacterium]
MKSLAKPHRLVVALMLALIGPSIDAANTAEVEARLSALESRWDQMEAELSAIRALVQNAAPAPSADLPAAVGAVSKTVDGLGADLAEVRAEVESQSQALAAVGAARQRDIAISSYGAVNFGKRSGQDSIIDAESFELVLSGQPHERISFFSEIEFERAASVGAERGGEVLLEQAYVDLAWNESLALRAGVILVPFGNNEADHYAPLRDVIARPLSSRLIAPSDWTDNGFGLVGHAELNPDWQLDWEAYLIAGLDDQFGYNGLRNNRQGFGVDNNNDKALSAHLTLRQSDQLALGLGIYSGAYDDAGKQQLRGIGLDWTWRWDAWKFTGEYLSMRAEREHADPGTFRGGYARVGYDLDRWFPDTWKSETFPDARLSLIYEYDHVSVQDLTSVSAMVLRERERKHLLGLRYEPDHSWIFKLNREWSDASGRPLVNGDADGWTLGIGFVF